MRRRDATFVDSGAWIALALTRDPYHLEARSLWDTLQSVRARLYTSVPVVIETFTFLDRNANRDVALAWRNSIYQPGVTMIVPCELRDLERAWEHFRRPDLHRLSAVDATSFAIMTRMRIRVAFTFDRHFAVAGFRFAG